MSDIDYTYAVARIRALEVSLFSAATLEQLIACDSFEGCIAFLQERGWGDPQGRGGRGCNIETGTGENLGDNSGMVSDMKPFDVLSYQNLFHNLKAAIKEVCTEEINQNIFYEECPIGREDMLRIVREKDFSSLPDFMQEPAKEAYETLLHSRDGQLCDAILDQAALSAIYQAGQQSKDRIVKTMRSLW